MRKPGRWKKRAVWPDWALFLNKVAQMCFDILGSFENIHFHVITAGVTFWATFGIFWATLYFSVWSHWKRERERVGEWLVALRGMVWRVMEQVSSVIISWIKELPKYFQTLAKYNWSFSKQPKSPPSFWAIFVCEYVAKNFQKSPNLVTLQVRDRGKRFIGRDRKEKGALTSCKSSCYL